MVYPIIIIIIPHRVTVVNSGAFNDLSLCYTQTHSCSFSEITVNMVENTERGKTKDAREVLSTK